MSTEPKPAALPPPQGAEPRIRVGLLIPQDARTECELGPSSEEYLIEVKSTQIDLKPGSKCRVKLVADKIELTLPGKSEFFALSETLTFRPKQPSPLAPTKGLRLAQVPAGRGFHWQKTVDLIYPGVLEIRSSGASLVAINELGFEDYCACVLASEMSPLCPAEFIKAQATAARSWAYVFLRNKHPGELFQICNDDDCQRYQGSTFLTPLALEHFQGSRGFFVLSPGGTVCPAYYSKCCGGIIEEPRASFGFEAPGLSARFDGLGEPPLKPMSESAAQAWTASQAASDAHCSPSSVPPQQLKNFLGAVDEQGSYFRWTFSISRENLSRLVSERCESPDLNLVDDIKVLERGISGRITKLEVFCRGQDGNPFSLVLPDQYQIRKTLHPSFLYSSAFTHYWKPESSREQDTLELRGAGWGHGVGLCQIGAVGMALRGKMFTEILTHYFPRCEVRRVY